MARKKHHRFIHEVTRNEWDEIQDELLFLECLHGAGVDNWEGYEHAMDEYRERSEKKGNNR